MKSKIGFAAGLLLTVAFGLTLMPGPIQAESITLSYANFPPAPTFPCVQMERWKEEVEQRTNGKISVQTYPGGTLLGAKDMMDGVIQGQADIGCLCMAYQPGRFKITNGLALPLRIPNARAGSMVLWDIYQKYQPKAFDQVKVLTMFTTAPSNIMSKKPIRTLEDLKGFDLRASGGAAQILKRWGANQVGMPMSETPSALQKGVVQGLFSSLEVMMDFKFAEICPYITLTETVLYPFAVVMNMDAWNKLPQDVQEVFKELGPQQASWTGTYMDRHVQESIAWSQENHGVEVIELSPEQDAQWNKTLVAPIVHSWIEDHQAKDIPAAEVVKDIKDFSAMYNGEFVN